MILPVAERIRKSVDTKTSLYLKIIFEVLGIRISKKLTEKSGGSSTSIMSVPHVASVFYKGRKNQPQSVVVTLN